MSELHWSIIRGAGWRFGVRCHGCLIVLYLLIQPTLNFCHRFGDVPNQFTMQSIFFDCFFLGPHALAGARNDYTITHFEVLLMRHDLYVRSKYLHLCIFHHCTHCSAVVAEVPAGPAQAQLQQGDIDTMLMAREYPIFCHTFPLPWCCREHSIAGRRQRSPSCKYGAGG